MANPRVHEIANELGIDSKIALAKLTEMGEFVKSASSSIAPPVARRLKKALEEDGVAKPAAAPAPKPAAKPAPKPGPKPAPAAPEGKAWSRKPCPSWYRFALRLLIQPVLQTQ